MRFINSHFLSAKKRKAAAICIPHFCTCNGTGQQSFYFEEK